ncbi:MAG: hypothetical protein IJZ74_12725 [Clostridia bacterium]|nr:hypothetical protein [Clostridia bacterium]
MIITIEGWDYLLCRMEDHCFRVWHHISPTDGCYGTEVDISLPADYFETHSVKALYELIAPMQHCRPSKQHYDKHAEIKKLKEQLSKAGLI